MFKNISDSFVDIPATTYPLVITLQKFLRMLDGTLGDSFFDRFNSQNLGERSLALETFLRSKEVTSDKFDSLYWPHFNCQYTKKLSSSEVFTEIISHIKGGIQATEPSSDGKLSGSGDDYVSLSEKRTSTLSKHRRVMIYNIYESYEKMKMDRGEFDLADFVIDLHHRLLTKGYQGDKMDFVYIDEVQDLSICQIALLRYVCHNVEEGFVFCGDSAQTIAKGIDFRFQDIRSLFYKKFVNASEGSSSRNEKGKVSEILLLNHNFRTHAGVLRLSHSITELILHFFPQSIDVLKPETSLIYGEAPVVLQHGNREDAFGTIFGHEGGGIVGFGADQVILVRDDSARKEILDHVGKHALVLTILECKGLEFKDVLLYNFFGSSPLKNKWRVIYQYIEEKHMFETAEHESYPKFNNSKHNILCSELKQLYVAITRTRQRLWIYDNTQDFSGPIFEYWRKKFLVQFKELDDSLARAMKVASSSKQWKSRGIELYHQNNYEMAAMCFERAGDFYWQTKSKAVGLRATATRLRDLNPEEANAILREAAEIFERIGMADTASQCFFDLGDYERAGKLYLEKGDKPDLKRAGDCFYLAGCYRVAAEVYASGNFFLNCLTACEKGGLHNIGLDYIQNWKQNQTCGQSMVRIHDQSKFLESCARNFLDHKDTRSMMKFVKAFPSMDMMRDFLCSLSLLDELLLLEVELGNFMEAADTAKMMVDIPRAADLLGKAGKLMEASELVIVYILANSLWSSGRRGWPLKQFAQKAELSRQALSFAKGVPGSFYERAFIEVEVLSNEQSHIVKIMKHLISSRKHESIRGEILCLWKLLDAHLRLDSSKYVYDVFNDSVEEMILNNQLSVETLFYCWTCWKDNIVHILQYLPSLKSQDIHQNSSYGQFALHYLGVQKHISNLNDYLLLFPDANWVIKMGDESLRKKERPVSVDVDFLISAAHSYWCSELLSVGKQVLNNLHAFYKLSVGQVLSEFCQFRSLMLIYEVSKFLLESECFSHSPSKSEALKKFRRFSVDCFFRYAVPLDRRKSLTKGMISLRETEACQNLLIEVIHENIEGKHGLTFGQIGRVAVLVLGMANRKKDLCLKIEEGIEGTIEKKKILEGDKSYGCWATFIKHLHENSSQEFSQSIKPASEWHITCALYEALKATRGLHMSYTDEAISPYCFVDLIERLLLLTSCWKGFIYATKSSFIEWLIYQDGNSLADPISSFQDEQPNLKNVHNFICFFLHYYLSAPSYVDKWMIKSNIDVENRPLFFLRLVVSLCLFNLVSGHEMGMKYLKEFLDQEYSHECLPPEFLNVLLEGRNDLGLKVFARAFKMIGDPLVIVRLLDNSSEIECPDTVSVDLKTCQQKELILAELFPNTVDSVGGKTAAVMVEASESTSKKNKSKKNKKGKKGKK